MDEFPAFYNESELEMLENTNVRSEIEKDRANQKNEFDF
jgi:hypothetical protein